MHLQTLPLALLGLLATIPLSSADSPKRGLVHVRNTLPSDEDPFKAASPLTWYYNYQWSSSPSLSSTNLSFVPMLWGAPGSTNDTTFLKNMTTLLDSLPGDKPTRRGRVKKVRATVDTARLHVLGFNQPDEPFDHGGANISAKDAAELWLANFVPLREKGVRIGLPCMQADKGPEEWLVPFLGNCSEMMGKQKREVNGRRAKKGMVRRAEDEASRWLDTVRGSLRGHGQGVRSRQDSKSSCPFDFVPIHAFGNASAIQSRVELYAKALNAPIWLTEWAPSNLPLEATQTAFNTTLAFLDSSPLVERHAYFGSFRSTASNVGPNPTMLDSWGRLTDIGAWYLGLKATGNDPVQTVAPAAGKTTGGKACTPENPCTGAGARIVSERWRVWGSVGLAMGLAVLL